MMHSRDFFSGGIGERGCHYGYGIMYGGWNMIIAIGVFVVISILIYFLLRNNKKKAMVNQSSHSSLEALKMKFVQGEITEEEYYKRKNIIDQE